MKQEPGSQKEKEYQFFRYFEGRQTGEETVKRILDRHRDFLFSGEEAGK